MSFACGESALSCESDVFLQCTSRLGMITICFDCCRLILGT
jgi:hypothetical protein